MIEYESVDKQVLISPKLLPAVDVVLLFISYLRIAQWR